MKISKIEFENFRNFKEQCCITFPTDGSVTVIYGPNGVGGANNNMTNSPAAAVRCIREYNMD